jgi:hypothetical protein
LSDRRDASLAQMSRQGLPSGVTDSWRARRDSDPQPSDPWQDSERPSRSMSGDLTCWPGAWSASNPGRVRARPGPLLANPLASPAWSTCARPGCTSFSDLTRPDIPVVMARP